MRSDTGVEEQHMANGMKTAKLHTTYEYVGCFRAAVDTLLAQHDTLPDSGGGIAGAFYFYLLAHWDEGTLFAYAYNLFVFI